MKKNFWLIAVAASMLPFALNGCYTQVASVGEDVDSEVYAESSEYDTTGGDVTVNNYYGSDSYRDWRFRTSFRYYPHRPYWLWSVGWSDPYWYDDYDPWYNSGWDYWGYSPYRHYPWSYYPGWPAYSYYSDYCYGNPYYYGRSIYGIPVYSYGGGPSDPGRRRNSGMTRGDDPARSGDRIGVVAPAAPLPLTGSGIGRLDRSGDRSGEVRTTETKPRTRPSQETPWWQRTDRPRGGSSNDVQAVPAGRQRPVGGTTLAQPEVRKDRPRPTVNSSVPGEAVPTRRPRTETPTPAPPPAARPVTRERPQQSREAVSAPSREAPRSAPTVRPAPAPAPSAPQRESTPRQRKAD